MTKVTSSQRPSCDPPLAHAMYFLSSSAQTSTWGRSLSSTKGVRNRGQNTEKLKEQRNITACFQLPICLYPVAHTFQIQHRKWNLSKPDNFVKRGILSTLMPLPLLAHKTLQRHNKAHLHEDREKRRHVDSSKILQITRLTDEGNWLRSDKAEI